MKGHCKDYEAKNRVLLTEKEALEQQLRVMIFQLWMNATR